MTIKENISGKSKATDYKNQVAARTVVQDLFAFVWKIREKVVSR
jgi:hypothetical protein